MVARYFREVVEWFDSNALDYRDVAQLVERYIRDVEVVGSRPAIPTAVEWNGITIRVS